MKKFTNSLLAAAAVISSISVVSATDTSSKTGAYLGGSVGVANTNVKYSFTNAGVPYTSVGGGSGPSVGGTVYGQNIQANTVEAGKFGGLFGLFAGYGMQMNSLYFGGEVYFGADTSKVTAFNDQTGYGAGYTTAGVGLSGALFPLVNASIKRSMYYGFAPRFGGFITPSTLLYVRLGVEAGKWQATVANVTADVVTANSVSSGPFKASKNSINFAPGLGLEAYVTKNLFVRAEYSYLFGPTVKIKQDTSLNDSWSGTYVNHTFKVTQQSFKVGVGYKF